MVTSDRMSTKTTRTKPAGPIGQPAQEARRRRARSPEYQAESARLAPYEVLARLVIKHRLDRNLTQKELAARMGTSHSAISRIESGQHPASLQTMKRLAEALDARLVIGFESDTTATAPTRELVAI